MEMEIADHNGKEDNVTHEGLIPLLVNLCAMLNHPM